VCLPCQIRTGAKNHLRRHAIASHESITPCPMGGCKQAAGARLLHAGAEARPAPDAGGGAGAPGLRRRIDDRQPALDEPPGLEVFAPEFGAVGFAGGCDDGPTSNRPSLTKSFCLLPSFLWIPLDQLRMSTPRSEFRPSSSIAHWKVCSKSTISRVLQLPRRIQITLGGKPRISDRLA
jgi:hypothetical protein